MGRILTADAPNAIRLELDDRPVLTPNPGRAETIGLQESRPGHEIAFHQGIDRHLTVIPQAVDDVHLARVEEHEVGSSGALFEKPLAGLEMPFVGQHRHSLEQFVGRAGAMRITAETFR